MITTHEFDKLLNLVMLDLTDQEYEMYMKQMDQIIGYMDKLKELDIEKTANNYQLPAGKISLDRNYKTNTIWLSNVAHPITGNMIQIKFKRG